MFCLLWTNALSLSSKLYEFVKAPIPEEPEKKAQLAEALLKFGVSIVQYQKAYAMEEITM